MVSRYIGRDPFPFDAFNFHRWWPTLLHLNTGRRPPETASFAPARNKMDENIRRLDESFRTAENLRDRNWINGFGARVEPSGMRGRCVIGHMWPIHKRPDRNQHNGRINARVGRVHESPVSHHTQSCSAYYRTRVYTSRALHYSISFSARGERYPHSAVSDCNISLWRSPVSLDLAFLSERTKFSFEVERLNALRNFR